jgi:quercetin dioxygenase-like cupin family protein
VADPQATSGVSAAGEGDALWFLGTLLRVRLEGAQTEGRLGCFEVTLPRGAAPPLHSHPQDETIIVLEGSLTAWIVKGELAAGDERQAPAWVAECAHGAAAGAVVYAAGGTPHSFRVESDTARLLTLSTPAGIEGFASALAEPALWPWLPPPPDGPRVSAEKMSEVERRYGMVRHGPPPPAL